MSCVHDGCACPYIDWDNSWNTVFIVHLFELLALVDLGWYIGDISVGREGWCWCVIFPVIIGSQWGSVVRHACSLGPVSQSVVESLRCTIPCSSISQL